MSKPHPIPAFLSVAICCFFSLPSASAAGGNPYDITYGKWHHSLIGGGGYIQNVVLCPSDPQRAYSYVDNSGAFRSDDGGRNWRAIHAGIPSCFSAYGVRQLIVDPRDANKILMALGSEWEKPLGLYLSEDGGVTWKQTLEALFPASGYAYKTAGDVLVRHPQMPDELLAASTSDGLFRSHDNGKTWENLGLKGICTSDIKYDRGNSKRLWLCSQVAKLHGSYAGRVFKEAFYRSEDGGSTWNKVSDASPTEIIQDPVDSKRLYGIFKERLIRTSTDSGETWADFSDGLALELDPKKTPAEISEQHYRALAAGPDFVLTASCKGTFYRLKCGETRWQKVQRLGIEEIYCGEPWFGDAGHFGSALCSITVDPKNPSRWFFTDYYSIYQTEDAGQHWKLSDNGVDACVVFGLEQDPADPGKAYLGMADNAYFYSDDGAARFHNIHLQTMTAKSAAVSPALPGRVYMTGSGFLNKQGNPVHGNVPNLVWVSPDHGYTWIRSPMNGVGLSPPEICGTVAVDPKDAYTVYIGVSGKVVAGGGGGGVYRSTDGGANWTWMSEGMPVGQRFFRDIPWGIGREIAIDPSGQLVAITGQSLWVWRFDRAANKWVSARLPGNKVPNCVAADSFRAGRFFVAVPKGGIYRSDDAGATWRQISSASARHVAVDKAKPDRVAAGIDDGVILSNDGGTTWETLDKSLPMRFYPVVAFAGDRLLAATNGNGCFWYPLTAAAAAPIKAAPTDRAYAVAAKAGASVLPGGASALAEPATWAKRIAADSKGKIIIEQDPGGKDGRPALVIRSDGGYVHATLTVAVPSSGQPLVMGGWLKSSGISAEILLGAGGQCFYGPGHCPANSDWRQCAFGCSPKPGPVSIQMEIKGEGKLWICGYNIAAIPIFQKPALRQTASAAGRNSN
jgi:photosystem II stability/assembly factor-like uncharacterized protein